MNLSQQFFKNYWQHIFLNFRDEKFETIRFMMEDKNKFLKICYTPIVWLDHSTLILSVFCFECLVILIYCFN